MGAMSLLGRRCTTLITAVFLAAAVVASAAQAAGDDPGLDLSGYRVEQDLHYGEDPKQVFDLYVRKRPAERAAPPPTVIFTHGGGYYLSDKAEEEHYIRPLLRAGFDVINTNYRLGQGVFAATEDLARLLRHLDTAGDAYGLASDRFVLMGFSAGGQMSANIGFWQNEKDDPFDIPKDVDIVAVVNISGPSHGLREVQQTFLNYDYPPFRALGAALFPPHPEYSADQVIALIEPLNHFDDEDPPLFLWYGGRDPQIPPSRHGKLLQLLEPAPAKHRIVFEPAGGHSPRGDEFSRLYAELFTFLHRL